MFVKKLIKRLNQKSTLYFIAFLFSTSSIIYTLFTKYISPSVEKYNIYIYDEYGTTKYDYLIYKIYVIGCGTFISIYSLIKMKPDWLEMNKKWLSNNKVSFFVHAFVFISFLLISIDIYTNNLFSEGFWNNVLIEAHGMFMDILVFGILFTLYERFYEKSNSISRYKEEIEDFRTWKGEESMYRIIGNVKRLLAAGVNEIDLSKCYLKDADLSYLDLSRVSLRNTNLRYSNLTNSKLYYADLSFTDFHGASLVWVSFFGATLYKTDFSGADLSDTFFTWCNLNHVIINENSLLNGLKFTYKANISNEVFKNNVINIFGERVSFIEVDEETLKIELI